MDKNRPLLTATKLWQGFCPQSLSLNYSINSRMQDGDVSFSHASFNAFETEDGRVRAAVTVAEKSVDVPSLRPAILYLADYNTTPSRELMINFAQRGYLFFALNYSGESSGDTHFTVYPPSLDYGNFEKAGG
jgi:hypothetical protein